MVKVLLVFLYEKSFLKRTFYILRYIFVHSYASWASNMLIKLFYMSSHSQDVLLYVIDLINRILQVLREDLYWFKISVQEAGLLEPTELGDKG